MSREQTVFLQAIDRAKKDFPNFAQQTSTQIWNLLPSGAQSGILDRVRDIIAGTRPPKDDTGIIQFIGSVLWDLIPAAIKDLIKKAIGLVETLLLEIAGGALVPIGLLIFIVMCFALLIPTGIAVLAFMNKTLNSQQARQEREKRQVLTRLQQHINFMNKHTLPL